MAWTIHTNQVALQLVMTAPTDLLIGPLGLRNGPVKVVSHGNLSGQTFIHLRSEFDSVHSHVEIICVCGEGRGYLRKSFCEDAYVILYPLFLFLFL